MITGDRRPPGAGRWRPAAWVALPCSLWLLTAAGRALGANAATIGFLYLLLVLGLATWGGGAVGAVAAVAATLAFNYSFLPPHGTLNVAEPANWVALLCFLAASALASRLVTSARTQAAEAERRRREVEALAVERERLLGEAAHLEAVRESEALKTSLLRAVSHDLRTPLTAIRLEIESLDRQLAGQTPAEASLRILGREQERLARRIDNLLALARLDAGLARPKPEAVPPSALFHSACESLALVLDGRPVETRVAPRCPDLWVDPWLALESVANLLENAARAAPAGRPIELAAAPDPGAPGRVRLEVLDRGLGLHGAVRHRFQGPRDLRPPAGADDTVAGGLGLQIAGSFAQASGGALHLLDRPGGGTVARLDLPAAPELEAPEEEA